MSARLGDFTAQAEAYSRARPGYPRELIPILLDLIEIEKRDPVVDLGAGTGIFTRLLAESGLSVTAIEPNSAMLAKAPSLEGVTYRQGRFEETGLETASQGWVVAAQAFHWALPEKALPEIRRVLSDCGALTVLWNNRDVERSEVLAWTRELIEERVPGFDESYRTRDWNAVLESTGDFQVACELSIAHVITMTSDRYLDLWRSHHLLNSAAGPASMRELLVEISLRLEGRETVDIPYICRSWTALATKRSSASS